MSQTSSSLTLRERKQRRRERFHQSGEYSIRPKDSKHAADPIRPKSSLDIERVQIPSRLRDFAEMCDVDVWPKMAEIFDAVEAGVRGDVSKKKILVRSCNGAGKTAALAAICNWYFLTHPDSIVITTASSATQVKRNLWGEIRKQARKGGIYNGRTDVNGRPLRIWECQIKESDKHFMIGLAPDTPENAQGYHAPQVLIAIDEATAINREILDALMGNLTGIDAQIVMICNPIDMQSFAYDAEVRGDWHVISISAFDHPNVAQGKESIKGAVTRRWIEDRLRAWSYEVRNEDSHDIPNSVYLSWLNTYYYKTPIVASRICGEWADYESEGFIRMEVIRNCVPNNAILRSAQDDVVTLGGIKCMGVDIARSGKDETVFAYFDGNKQLPFETFREQDTMRTAERIKARYDAGWTRIALDDTGVGGGVTDRLRQLGVPVIAVNFAQSPKGYVKQLRMIDLANARAEMFFLLEMELRNNEIELVDDAEFHQELAAVRLAISESTAVYRLEDKELTRRRLGRSPDKADAAALARYALRLPEPREKLWFL